MFRAFSPRPTTTATNTILRTEYHRNDDELQSTDKELAADIKDSESTFSTCSSDILEEQIVLNGISLRMIDTAGIRKTDDTVEKIGVERAREYAKDADLILYVVDASQPLDENDASIMELL